MKILIIGANGQLGRELQRTVPSEWGVTAIGTADCDITDSAAVATLIEGLRPDVVVNCAAYTAVDQAETERETADAVNWLAVENLARVAATAGVALVHISTDYVFDGESCVPYRESDPTAPINHYGAGKLRGEQAIAESGCRGVVIRTQWLYSPYGKNFVKTMLRLATQQREVRVVADQRGCPTAADDLAAAIVAILPEVVADNTLRGEVFHFASKGEATWCEFAEEIFRVAECDCRAVAITTDDYPTAARRPRNSVLDCSKICERFGVEQPDWRESLRRNIERIKKNDNPL
ncbi:MAG: dTDP-4-dehydrorhamnose reductase [Rikenellaceae bacterium]|nr:dTDP-4-dehydrorhamnose reductase [Rikenellaceae bacterium]